MTIVLSIEFVAKVPFLKKILTEEPGRTITHKSIFYMKLRQAAGIVIETVDQFQANSSLKRRLRENMKCFRVNLFTLCWQAGERVAKICVPLCLLRAQR